MKWSKFNHIFKSEKHGTFVYNATTNSFARLSDSLHDEIAEIKDWNTSLEQFDEDTRELLLKHSIVVKDDYDERFMLKKKYLRDMLAFNNNIVSLTIATTTNCNFMCPYCYEEGVKPLVMKPETEEAILNYVQRFRNIRITWYGGEPLMNFPSIVRMTDRIAAFEDLGTVSYEIITNGYFLDREKCTYFVDKNVKMIQMTIDGTEETHHKSRISKDGRSSYQRILKNIDDALDLLPNTQFAIRVNISMQNKDEYPRLYQELQERWKGRNNIRPYLSFVEDYGSCKSDCLSSKEKIEFMRELRAKHGIYEPIYPSGSSGGVCVANRASDYVVAPDGALYKCWADIGKTNLKVGTIFEVDKPTNFNLITDYAITFDRYNDKKCLDCFMFPVCDGGCPQSRYDKHHANPRRNVCPYKFENIDSILETIYESYLKVKHIPDKIFHA